MQSRKEEEEAASPVEEPSVPQRVESPLTVEDSLAPSSPVEVMTRKESPPKAGGRRGLRLFLVLLLILAGASGYGGYWWTWVRGTISTNDAYVETRIVSVASRLPERVEAVLVEEGDSIKKGQVLLVLASDHLRIRVQQRKAAMESAAAMLEEKRNSPRPEEIEVKRAEVNVLMVERVQQEKEVTRALKLARVKAISAQELERRRSALDGARSRLEVGRRRLTLLMKGPSDEALQRAEADLDLARAMLRAARNELGDVRLRASVEGVVAKRMVDPGEVVQKGQAVFQIVEAGNSWVVANLEEDQISQIREGQIVGIRIDAYPDQEFQGRVGSLYAATLSRFSLLPTSSASGSFIKVTQRVPVRIDWAQENLPPMFPGLNVTVRIQIGSIPTAQNQAEPTPAGPK